MYTQCPECQTTFKLGVADLRRAQGRVRCGDCNHVFNAVEYLAEQARDKADDGVPVLSAGLTEESAFEESAFPAEESLPPEQTPEFLIEPVPESTSPEPVAEPTEPEPVVEPTANEAPVHAILEAANDPEIRVTDNVNNTHEESGESWSPLEPSDDWLGNTGVIKDAESLDPAGILFDGDATDVSVDEPTREHILPPVDQGGLPTVTMEALAPKIEDPKIENIEEAAPAETNPDEAGYGFIEDDEDTNAPVVDPADEPEFQEASFGDDDDDAWSGSVYELSDDAAESAPDAAVAASEVTTEPTKEQTTESGLENGEVEGPAPITEAVPDFSDTIWDRIPGVGATDEDWETVRSGQHRALSEEDQLADGLSYTNTELKIVSKAPDDGDAAVEPSEDMAQKMADAAEPDAEQPESLAGDVVADDGSADDQENHDGLDFSVPEDKWESFFGDESQPSQQPSEDESPDDSAEEPATNETDAADEVEDGDEDPWQDVAVEAEQTLSGIYEQPDTRDFSETEEPEEGPDEADATEAGGDISAEMVAAFDQDEGDGENKDEEKGEDLSDYSDTYVSEDAETEANADADEEVAADKAAADSDDGDEQINTWSDLEPMEEVVLSTGIFGAAEIASLIKGEGEDETSAPERPLGQRTYEGEWEQPDDWAEADASESGSNKTERPTWQSDFIDTAKTAGKSSRSWLWLAGIMILVIGFPSQLIHYNRDSLAAHPSYGNFVRSIYAGLGGELYPVWPMDSYEIRGHEAVAGESGQDILDIRTEIAAVGETAVGVPHLRVILRDRWSNPLAARNFSPEEYAGAAELPAEGLMQPNQTIAAQVAIVDPGTGAQGYELELCLPRRNTGLDCTGVPFK